MSDSSSVYDWFQERLEIQDITDDVTSKYVPPHVNIFYCLGGITLVCFLIQFATGFAMTFYYKPTVTQAYPCKSKPMTAVSLLAGFSNAACNRRLRPINQPNAVAMIWPNKLPP